MNLPIPLRKTLRVSCIFGCLLAISAPAVTFSLNPSVISNTYSGHFTLQVAGLPNGSPVVIENFFDINANSVIDQGDMLLDSYRITEGQRAMIGGATNVSVPGDITGVDGSITTHIPYLPSRPQHMTGKHLVRVSSPSSAFTPMTNSLQITNWSYAQSISGSVTCSGTNVPFAVVIILTAAPDGKGELATTTAADNAGGYTVRLAAGDYQMLAFRPGYVFSAATGPQVSVSSGNNLTQNLTLLPAPQVFSGRVVDAGDTNLPISGLFMILQSASGFITVCSSDTEGYFRAPVLPDGWQVSIDTSSLAPLGYVSSTTQPSFDTTSSPVTNALITLTKATAMVYGTILNATNGPVTRVSLYGNNVFNTLESTGWSDGAGNYSIAVTPGTWWTGLDSFSLPPNSIIGGNDSDTLVAGQAVRRNLAVVQATTQITGTVRNIKGQPVPGAYLWANSYQNGVNFTSNGQTDLSGHYSISASGGTWNVGFQCAGDGGLDWMGYQCPYQPSVVAIPPGNPVLDFTLFPIGSPKLDVPQFTGPSRAAITLYGLPGTNYVLQYSADLADSNAWRTLTIFVATNQVNTLWDYNATGRARFYRAGIWQ